MVVLLGLVISICSLVNVLLVNSANSTLTDPGQVCPGNTVRLICDVTTAAVQTWFYWNERVAQVANASSSPIISPLPLQPIQGVIFDISVLSTNPYLVTQLSFVASNTMEGGNVTCRTVLSDTSLLPVNNEVLLQVENIGAPSNVRNNNTIFGIEDSTVTIEWTPPTNRGNFVYTITTTPAPLSPAVPVNTTSTNINITVQYNINYTVAVTRNTCAGVREEGTIFQAGCLVPLVSSSTSVQLFPFPATNEGAEIMYQCSPGFQPQNISTAVCGSNGLWLPDPVLHNCTDGTTVTGVLSSTTSINSTQDGSTMVSLLVVAVLSVVLFIVGVVGGFTGGALVVYCCFKTHHWKPHPPPPPVPLYDVVVKPTTEGQGRELELNDNVAYEQGQQLKLKDNVAYGQVR